MPSPTAQILLDIRARLEASQPYFPYPKSFKPSATGKFVYIWNNTVNRLREGKYAGVQTPIICLQISNPVGMDQLGNGLQDKLVKLRVHCIHKFVNATDKLVWGDQDLAIYEFTDWVYKMLQMFQPTQCGVMVRTNEEIDDNHDQIVDHVLEFTLKQIDTQVDQPINKSYIIPTPELTINAEIADDVYTSSPGDRTYVDESGNLLTPST